MIEVEKNSHILVIEDPSFRRTITLDKASYSLGRHPENDIVLSSQKTSRYHATFVRRTDIKTNDPSYWILDGNLRGNRSRNGIFINGKKCLVHELKHGDIIKFSNDVKARYHIVSNLAELADNYLETSEISSKKTCHPNRHKNTLISKETTITPYEPLNNSELVRLSSFAELSSQSIIEIDLNGNITYINPVALITFKDIFQKKLEHPLLKGLTEICDHQIQSCVRQVSVEDKVFNQNSYYLPENKIIRSYLTDITQHNQLEFLLKNRGVFYESLLQKLTDNLILLDSQSYKILFINTACTNLLGYSSNLAYNLNIDDLSFDSSRIKGIFNEVITTNKPYNGDYLFRHQDGFQLELNLDIIFVDFQVEKIICLILRHPNENLIFNQDNAFLGLSEKKVYEQQLKTALANAKRNKTLLAVISITIEDFLEIDPQISNNFRFLLFASISDRLRSCLRSGDTVSYWGEEKFALILQQIEGVEEVAKISQRIIKSLENSFKIEEQILHFNSNLGIAIYPQDGENSDVLIKNADSALEQIKKKENYNYSFYSSNMNSQTSVLLKLEKFLYEAIEKKELLLHYQPQVNIRNSDIQGIEALLRWQHPELGLLLPKSFIKLAEKSGLMLSIGKWVLTNACNQSKIWQAEGLPPIKMSVNISAVEFKQPNFAWLVETILQETGLAANLLELEITANTLMEDDEYSYQVLCQLRDLGVTIAIDDFTAGFSSLEKLKKLPLNTLKIAQNFVKKLTNNSQDLAVISTTIALGKGLNLRVIAEGVETQEQMKLLQSQECELMQGFWFGRPLAPAAAIKLLPFDY